MRQIAKPQSVYNPSPEPWSHACMTFGNYVFLSGGVPTDKRGKTLWKNDIVRQTEHALNNMKRMLAQLGLGMGDVVRLMWFVTSADKFYSSGASDVRKKYFPKKDYPTSTLVEVVRLADPDWMVEIQATAVYE